MNQSDVVVEAERIVAEAELPILDGLCPHTAMAARRSSQTPYVPPVGAREPWLASPRWVLAAIGLGVTIDCALGVLAALRGWIVG